MLHRFPKGLTGEKVHQKRLPAGAPPWVETVRLHFPRWDRTADELCVTELAACHLGGADVHRRVPPLEQPACGHREARRVAHRPRPRARVRLRPGAAGRPRRARGARRARRRRLPQDQRRPGPARLRPHPRPTTASPTYDGPRWPSPARWSAARPTTSPHLVAQGPRPPRRSSSTTTRTPATTRSRRRTRCAACPTRGSRPRSAGTRSTTPTPATSPSPRSPPASPSSATCTPTSTSRVFDIAPLLEWADGTTSRSAPERD